jgi:hypothetical protein
MTMYGQPSVVGGGRWPAVRGPETVLVAELTSQERSRSAVYSMVNRLFVRSIFRGHSHQGVAQEREQLRFIMYQCGRKCVLAFHNFTACVLMIALCNKSTCCPQLSNGRSTMVLQRDYTGPSLHAHLDSMITRLDLDSMITLMGKQASVVGTGW